MKILVACEFSGTVRDAFRDRGHDALSCDLLPCEREGPHYRGDVLGILNDGWDLMVAHPPCTYLTVSGLHWNKRNPERALLTEEGLAFVQLLLDAPIPRIALENPVGCISSRIRRPDQIIQPYEFGADASKKTCLWLKNLSPLPIDPSMRFPGRMVPRERAMGKSDREKGSTGPAFLERWSNQTDTGQSNLGPSEDRWAKRSITYPGIATAMAETWG